EYTAVGKKRYEVEHIWANRPERHVGEFPHEADFAAYRNRIGGLLLVPKSFNASYGDLPYEDKLQHYNSQNLLARSLHSNCYHLTPRCPRIPMGPRPLLKPHQHFKKKDLDERQLLYCLLAEHIWRTDQLVQQLQESAA